MLGVGERGSGGGGSEQRAPVSERERESESSSASDTARRSTGRWRQSGGIMGEVRAGFKMPGDGSR